MCLHKSYASSHNIRLKLSKFSRLLVVDVSPQILCELAHLEVGVPPPTSIPKGTSAVAIDDLSGLVVMTAL